MKELSILPYTDTIATTPYWLVILLITFPLVSCNESGIVEPEEMPEITRTAPENRAEEVPAGTTIEVFFNKKMNPSTISSSTFFLMQNGTAVLGVISTTDTSATLAPLGNLTPNETFTATITTDVEDMSGNNLASNYSWNFRTTTAEEDTVGEEEEEGAPDNTPPVVRSTNPEDHEVDVPVDAVVSATFSEEMEPSSLNTSTFTLRYGTSEVSGEVEYEGNTATFVPSSELPAGNTFTATITTDVVDASGNAIEEVNRWSFTTQEQIDETPPEVVETDPEDNEDDVDPDTRITITFNEELNPSTIDESTFTVEWGFFGRGIEVEGSVEYDDQTIIFIPDERLRGDVSYTATISSEIEDAAGNALGRDYDWNFRTDDDDDDDDD